MWQFYRKTKPPFLGGGFDVESFGLLLVFFLFVAKWEG